MAAELAAAGPAAGGEAEASSRPGTGAAITSPDLEPAIGPDRWVVHVLAAAARSRAFTASPSPAAGLVAGA